LQGARSDRRADNAEFLGRFLNALEASPLELGIIQRYREYPKQGAPRLGTRLTRPRACRPDALNRLPDQLHHQNCGVWAIDADTAVRYWVPSVSLAYTWRTASQLLSDIYLTPIQHLVNMRQMRENHAYL
jgi:hypothetical protein